MKNFADRLYEAIDATQNPSVIGLDPRLASIPDFIKQDNIEKHGKTFEAASSSIFDFNKSLLEELQGIVPAVKPQMAFYEQYGSSGIKAFEDTVKEAKKLGFLVIADGKRNDIGSTSEGYANAFLGESDLFSMKKPCFDVDCLTVNAYLGSDGILPFTKVCKGYGKGIFVLVKTSNPSSAELQDLKLASEDIAVFEKMASLVKRWGEDDIGEYGYSSIGAVVGSTYPEEAKIIRELLPNSFILVPGYGAQGGTADDAMPNFNADGFGAIVNSSRGVIFAYEKSKGRQELFATAARESALLMQQQLHSSMKRANIFPW